MVISIAELICISLAGFGDWSELGLLRPARDGEMGGAGLQCPFCVADGTIQGTNAWR